MVNPQPGGHRRFVTDVDGSRLPECRGSETESDRSRGVGEKKGETESWTMEVNKTKQTDHSGFCGRQKESKRPFSLYNL
ncbi:hypothetical protein RUM44_010846 [Polyplax serrata]|uniref:Uncharacterized protein n=1 Tax=Polyplax serrata TaxID=468196 RepID=A0ABR1APX1_POLSC